MFEATWRRVFQLLPLVSNQFIKIIKAVIYIYVTKVQKSSRMSYQAVSHRSSRFLAHTY